MPSFTFFEWLCAIVMGFAAAMLFNIYSEDPAEEAEKAKEALDHRCDELCDGFSHSMVKATPDGCFCKDPETKKAQRHFWGAPDRTDT